jgi:hypothetical protein
MDQKYKFSATVWKYPGKGGWYFASLPKTVAKKIRQNHGLDEEGWGRLKTQVSLGDTTWNTSIWFDSKLDTYVLPIKADIRKKERIRRESKIQATLYFTEQP